MDRSLAEILQSLLTRVQNRDFGLGFVVDVVALALAVLLMISPDSPNVYGDDPRVPELATALYVELTGENPPIQGPFSSAVLVMVVRLLIAKAIEALVDAGLPEDVVELIRKWLETLRDRI